MTDTSTKVREHYSAPNLTNRIKAALATLAPEGQMLTVAQLAPLDQFHTWGILATTELATAAGLEPSTRALDLGCGIGGAARYLAATFGCKVKGVDLTPSFIDADSPRQALDTQLVRAKWAWTSSLLSTQSFACTACWVYAWRTPP